VKRLLRFVVRGVMTLSLLLGLATAALWVRSYHKSDFVGRGGERGWYGALSMSGLFRFERASYPRISPGWRIESYDTPGGGLWNEVQSGASTAWQKMGFHRRTVDYKFDGKHMRYSIYLPHWLLCAVFGVPVIGGIAIRLAGHQKRRRARLGLCISCGYDLRASPQRCPECGRVHAGSAAPA
jgi:hypothetical protein